MSLLFPPPPPEDAPDAVGEQMNQGKYWVNGFGEALLIDRMTPGHVENCMAMMIRKSSILTHIATGPMWSYSIHVGDAAHDSIMSMIDEIESDSEKWVKSTPLYRALKKRRKALRKAAKFRAASERLLMLPEIQITRDVYEKAEWKG
jgi:hypothetical protein